MPRGVAGLDEHRDVGKMHPLAARSRSYSACARSPRRTLADHERRFDHDHEDMTMTITATSTAPRLGNAFAIGMASTPGFPWSRGGLRPFEQFRRAAGRRRPQHERRPGPRRRVGRRRARQARANATLYLWLGGTILAAFFNAGPSSRRSLAGSAGKPSDVSGTRSPLPVKDGDDRCRRGHRDQFKFALSCSPRPQRRSQHPWRVHALRPMHWYPSVVIAGLVILLTGWLCG